MSKTPSKMSTSSPEAVKKLLENMQTDLRSLSMECKKKFPPVKEVSRLDVASLTAQHLALCVNAKPLGPYPNLFLFCWDRFPTNSWAFVRHWDVLTVVGGNYGKSYVICWSFPTALKQHICLLKRMIINNKQLKLSFSSWWLFWLS